MTLKIFNFEEKKNNTNIIYFSSSKEVGYFAWISDNNYFSFVNMI